MAMKQTPFVSPDEGLDDVRVDQVSHQLGFADEIFDEHLLARVIRPDDFDRHPLDEIARPVLFSLINNPHAALKNLADDGVSEITLDGKQRHCPMFGNRLAKSSPAQPTLEKLRFFCFFRLHDRPIGLNSLSVC